jgi:hypothetical protein
MRFRFLALTIAIAVLSSFATWKLATAQVTAARPVNPPRVMSGADVGFRVEALRGRTPVGVFVVNVNGQWVEAEISPGSIRSLSAR